MFNRTNWMKIMLAISLVLTSCPVYYHAQAATTKIAEWRFDEGNGTTTKETVGNTSDPIHYVFNNAVYKPLSPRSGERMASPIVHYYLMDTQHG